MLDEMLTARIAEQLRAQGWDAEAVTDHPELRSLQDHQLLEALGATRHVIVTDNVADFVQLHRAFLEQDRYHAGIICCSIPRSVATIGRWVQALDAMLAAAGAEVGFEHRCIWLA